MHVIDIIVFLLYFSAMLGVGFYFFKRNRSVEDYYVGGRAMGSWHIGLSVVATDVGGGFSIGLGGLGFAIGLSGSWMLFTGLIGAWLSAVFLIPMVSRMSVKKRLITFPQLFEHFYDHRVALLAGLISMIGYIGFTSSQLLAGAKLASATIPEIGLKEALVFMGLVAVLYTAFGGLKAVIYTDTIQWIILMSGLIFIGIPFAYEATGGFKSVVDTVGSSFISLSNITWQQLLNWGVTIIPIWFVGMTLYQRIYAAGSIKKARKAWFIAGLFEWPLMAFMGVALGLFARVAFEKGLFSSAGFPAGSAIDPEIGLPVLLNTILPVGLTGLVLSSYFSAILSTADSCLMAASGNLQTDILGRFLKLKKNAKYQLRLSQFITFGIGILAILLASFMSNVLEMMLYSYAFMVSGLFVPVLAALYGKKPDAISALSAMITGGTLTVVLIILDIALPFGLDANIFGITASAVVYLSLHLIRRIFAEIKTTKM